MTSLIAVIVFMLSSLGVPGLEEHCLDPANPCPCSAVDVPSDGGGQSWGSMVQGPDGHKISNGF